MPVVAGGVDLHLIAVVDGPALVDGSFRHADEDAGVIVVAGGLEDDAEALVTDLLSGVPEQAHAAFGL